MKTLNHSMLYQLPAWLIVLLLLLGMGLAMLAGARVGKHRKNEEGGISGTILASLFGLFGLLLAFTFGMSGNRYDARRQSVVTEVNCIGTAVLRADLYPETERASFLEEFRSYVRGRIAYYQAGRNERTLGSAVEQTDAAAARLWRKAVALSRDPSMTEATRLMVPALNEMFDISTTHAASEQSTVPDSIVWLLLLLAVTSAFFSGYAHGGKKVDWLVSLGFCLLTAFVIFIILDLDRPRRGLITMDDSYALLQDLEKSIGR